MTALGAAWVTVKDASQGMRNCGTFREFKEIERGHLLATGVTCLCIYIHNYVSLKKELERQDHGGMSQGRCAIVAPLESLER